MTMGFKIAIGIITTGFFAFSGFLNSSVGKEAEINRRQDVTSAVMEANVLNIEKRFDNFEDTINNRFDKFETLLRALNIER